MQRVDFQEVRGFGLTWTQNRYKGRWMGMVYQPIPTSETVFEPVQGSFARYNRFLMKPLFINRPSLSIQKSR